MGCDTHLVVERRVCGKWIGVNPMRQITVNVYKNGDFGFGIPAARNRNYKRFARLAGVRGDGPAPNGLPDDISELTRLETNEWGSDGHSHGWLPLKDAARVWLETDRMNSTIDPTSYEAKYPEAHFFNYEEGHGEIADYRVVFWFDN